MLFNIVYIVLFLCIVGALSDKVKDTVFGGIFVFGIYIFEAIKCINRGNVNLLSKNSVLSVVLMVLLPFLIVFAFGIVAALFPDKKDKNNSENSKTKTEEQ